MCYQPGIPFERPYSHWLTGAAVDQDASPSLVDRFLKAPDRGQLEMERAGQDAPVFVSMRPQFRSRQGLGEKNLAAEAGETQAPPRAEQGQQQVVARVPPRRQANVEPFFSQPLQSEQFAPGPEVKIAYQL